MSVLKPLKDSETVQIAVKIPTDLRDRANKVREALKTRGFTIDIGEAAAAGIKRLVKSAEKELKELEAKRSAAPATSPAPKGAAKTAEPPPKPPQKTATTQKGASA